MTGSFFPGIMDRKAEAPTSGQTGVEATSLSWAALNWAFLEAELHCLRLQLQRRILWLRQQWQQDPLQAYQEQVISDAQVDQWLATEERSAEFRFYEQDAEAVALTQAIADTQQTLKQQGQIWREAGTLPALDLLVQLFGLTSFDRQVLLLGLAPDFDPSFGRLYAYVQDDVTCKYATPHLALTLFGGEGKAWIMHRDRFLPNAPLRRFQFILLESGRSPATPITAQPMRLDERIADYLRGTNRLDERIASLLRPLPGVPLSESQERLVERLQSWLMREIQQGQGAVLNLIGASGVGKRAVAKALGDRLGLHLYRLDERQLPPSGSDRQEILRLVEREAILGRLGLYLDTTSVDRQDRVAVLLLDDLIHQLGVILIVGSRERWRTEQSIMPVWVPKPDTQEQRQIWQQVLIDVSDGLENEISAIAQQFDLRPQAIAQAAMTAQTQARLRTELEEPNLTAADLWQVCRELSGQPLEAIAQRLIPAATWEAIVLPADAYAQLQEIAAQVTQRRLVYETWGFGRQLQRGRGISALFSGPSGTGKTMAAEILAHHLQLDLYRIDLAGVVSKYIGETEKNLRQAFDAAEQSGAILFFDEADALFGKRTEVKDSHDRYANIEVNYLLQRMEDYRGLAILATNRKTDMDRAFLRRLRFLVDFPFPDVSSRCRIWQQVFPPQAPVAELDYAFLSRLEIAGGNIKNIALNAAFLAADTGGKIGMEQVMRAVYREYVKIDKLITPSEFGGYYERIKS